MTKDYLIYSFDIFDTLLLRPFAEPQEVWKQIEEKEQAPGFTKARKAADAQTFKEAISRDGETTIETAYNLIPQFKHLMQKEMNLEREVLRANPEMLNMWGELGEQGKRRIIVSDMYLPSDFIQSVLRENGFDGWDGFYLSRDYDCRKSSGKLFEVMLQKEGVSPDNILHIGDNVISDVKMPESLGIHTHYYKKVIDRLYDVCPFVRHVNSKLAGVLAFGWHRFCLDHSNVTYWHRLGFMMGGVLGYIYVKWIVETAKHLGKDRLMFVARDGYVWKAICNAIYPEVETEYFYAPRQTSIAILGAIGSDPWAIKDRQNYIEQHLKGVDTDAIRREYRKYIKQFNIDEHTAMIDGCSSGFSAQRLVEDAVGRNVFCFYLLSMANMHSAAALYSTHLYSLQWQMLSEFLFGSPEKPIKDVSVEGPNYKHSVSEQEKFKISVSQEITDGAVACAKILMNEKVEITAPYWQEYINLFMLNLTVEDSACLSRAKNAADVEQKQFGGVIYKPLKHGVYFKKLGPRSVSLNYVCDISHYCCFLNRKGFHYWKKDLSTEIGKIVNN
ncbi:haloacid dehalogenase superfamily, subfamily IA, variant 1 with third motif having Dx(3-4)D or Dx(3-4)E [Prevotella sp. tc2-28]|uniref:HAD-IA family hydrolase n=1 Tax=Prevotella sp. tc2-28 TaxID=1761888 RepID=UPI0008982D33|nr:HAD-IA family hydrolase [Prevotella sp. tc2-28]SEA52092.1 haloacid dehalogenase superfamily, subfamily IA, variant 1 with third motif having Dx(3-4)D or Dx(3-4)E [Prevotella sp. tc2-28]